MKPVIQIAIFSCAMWLVWHIKEAYQIPDIWVVMALIWFTMIAANFEFFKVREDAYLLRLEFEEHRTEANAEIARLDRRIQLLYEEIDALHPDGPNRHWKKLVGDLDISDKDEK